METIKDFPYQIPNNWEESRKGIEWITNEEKEEKILLSDLIDDHLMNCLSYARMNSSHNHYEDDLIHEFNYRKKIEDDSYKVVETEIIELEDNELVEEFFGESIDLQDYNGLIKVSSDICNRWHEDSGWINGKIFKFKHIFFHQIIDNQDFLREKIIEFIHHYNRWMDGKKEDEQ